MGQYGIAVIVGSLKKDSFNRKLANAIVRLDGAAVPPGGPETHDGRTVRETRYRW